MAYDLRKATGRRERAALLVPFVVVHRDDLHWQIYGAGLPVDTGRFWFGRDGFESGRRRGVGADLCGASYSLETVRTASNSEKKPPTSL